MTADHTPDRFLEAILQRAALRLHDAEQALAAVRSPVVVPLQPDEDNLTAADRAACREAAAALGAYLDQRKAAKADHDEARRSYDDAYRLATGRPSLGPDGASVMAYVTVARGAAAVIASRDTPAPRVPPTPLLAAPRASARPRGAGPRAQAMRSSAESGDGGDDGGPEPPAPAPGAAERVVAGWLAVGARILGREERGR